ncbi:MAG: hypothetical protein GX454_12880 [Brooklawnia sp.]|nr:hypothetical protein [Brooklawnia sp.]
MIDYLKRLRSPGLMAVLAVIGVLVLMSVGHFVLLLVRGAGVAGAARQAGVTSPSLLWVFAAMVLAVTCVLIRPVVANGQRLVGAAAILVASATGVSAVFWAIALFGGMTLGVVLGAVGGLIEILAKAACAWVLWRMRGIGVEERTRLASSAPSTGEPVAASPVWNPQQATGLQWTRAGDAASGADASITRAALGRTSALPWTTAAQAADGLAPGPSDDLPDPDQRARRPAPDWAPAPRPDGPVI